MPLFESYERRIDKINEVLKANGIASLEEAKAICDEKGIDVAGIVKGIPVSYTHLKLSFSFPFVVRAVNPLHLWLWPKRKASA